MCSSFAGMTPQQVLQSNTDRWMMIPSSGVDLHGTACNKVGTSYTAFRYGQTVSLLHTPGVHASLQAPAAVVYQIHISATQRFWIALGEKHIASQWAESKCAPHLHPTECMPATPGVMPGQPAGRLLQCGHCPHWTGHHADQLCQPLGWRTAWRPAGETILPAQVLLVWSQAMW